MIEVAKQWFDQYDIWFVGLAAFSPLPYKLATITAGTMNMALLPFVLISLLARGARYYLVAFLVRKFGTQADVWLQKHIDRLGYVLVVVVILGIWYVN
jgi:membrane protein YqaA with SNARE-associated domain